MSATFSRSMRALQGEKFGRTTRILSIALIFLVLWSAWFLLARIAIYERSDSARIEVEQASHQLQAPMGGKVVATNLTLGRTVKVGDLLVELDTETEQRQIEESQEHLQALLRQIDALRSEMSSRQSGQVQHGNTGTMALKEAQARYDEADEAARFAEEQAERLGTLANEGGVAELELQRVRSEAQRKRTTAEAYRIDLVRIERQQQVEQIDRQVDMEHLDRDIALLEGEATTTRVAIQQLREEIERHRIRAGVAGNIGETTELTVGSVVHEGEKLGTIVPAGDLRIIADFSPPAVFGRIRTGQSASMRITGFPWTEYGSVPAVVTNVGREVRNGTVRVELALRPDHDSSIPVQHGLPGSVEVEVERITPASLLLRTTGALLGSEDGTSGIDKTTGGRP